MDSPRSFGGWLSEGSNRPVRNGRYPNSQQPAGCDFNTPVVARAANLNQGTTSHLGPPALPNADNGAPPNEQAGRSSSDGIDLTNQTASPRDNGTTTNNRASVIGDDILTPGADDAAAAPEVPSLNEENTHQSHNVELGGIGDEEYSETGTIEAPEPPPEPPSKKRTHSFGSVDHKPVKKPRKAPASGNPPKKVNDGAEPLKSKYFATKNYKHAQSLRPLPRFFRESSNDPVQSAGTTTETPSEDGELGDLICSLGTLTIHLQQNYFDSQQNTKSIDEQIAIGFKRIQDKSDQDGQENEENSKTRRKTDKLVPFNGLNKNLKPLCKIDDIFDDLTWNATKNGFEDFLAKIGSQKLKVSTLCSGTESPLLALQMIQESLRNGSSSYDLQLEHQFSCEIEPFKQAYIQRNFKPAVLFRDVRDLDQEIAPTAFGAEKPVPSDADIMIAGSSCIDYSALNCAPKEFGANGESYATLTATVEYAKKHKANIVILENVSGAKWSRMQSLWHGAGYATKVAKLDSKDFYLPQTRQRGYMIGLRRAVITERNVDLDADMAVENWFKILEKLQRRASSPFTDFIFEDEDVQLQTYNHGAAVLLTAGKSASWELCRAECLSYRLSNFLGFKKPLTEWENFGSCRVPDFCNQSWFKRQVERILDTLEINHLRSVSDRRYDFSHKSRNVDCSQSCLREKDSKPWGTISCITPSANPYLTRRGGPLLGAEALSLQGIPREKLILNRESSKQLIDLSGNAMTTTAVGASIVAALIACSEIFRHLSTSNSKCLKSQEESSSPTSLPEYDPKWALTKTDLMTDLHVPTTVFEIQALASATMRLCSCEGQTLDSSKSFKQCSRCGFVSCGACAIKPTHKYDGIETEALTRRVSATDFEERIRKALPTRLVIQGLKDAYSLALSTCQEQPDSDYVAAIEEAAAAECRLVRVKRDRGWSVIYESQHSRLVLSCQPKWQGHVVSNETFDNPASAISVRWNFYAKPHPALPANSHVRDDLMHPVARLTCAESLFDGQWEVRIAKQQYFSLDVVAKGEQTPSWEKKQGLQDPTFKNRFVWRQLEFRMPAGSIQSQIGIPDHILGSYDLLEDCGSACGSLHVKRTDSSSCNEEPVFLFLDPVPLGNATNDSFVFANEHHKLGVRDARDVIAKIESYWRPPSTARNEAHVPCEVPCLWIPVNDVQLEEHAPNDLRKVYLASANTAPQLANIRCDQSGYPVMWCKFSMPTKVKELGLKAQGFFKLVKDSFSLEPLSWLLKPAGLALNFTEWQNLAPADDLLDRCAICAPKAPSIVWKIVAVQNGHQIRPSENMEEACEYERNVQAAPEAVTAELSYDARSELAALKISFNILTLIHKAVAALSESPRSSSVRPKIHWRAVIDHGHNYQEPFPQLQLMDCQDHATASQPPSFGKYGQQLNQSQLKSHDWMIRREQPGDQQWEEQEVVEALVAPMSLRLEARATASHHVMGGVLADDVGYGKTALVIALIDYDFQNFKPVSPPPFTNGKDNMIALKATLILVPTNLTEQWRMEIQKFVGNTYKVFVLTKSEFVENSTVSSLQQADIILATWDLFDDSYFAQLARMSKAPHTPVSSGRGFEEWFQMAQEDLKTLVENSHGLRPELLRSAWHGLEKKKYDKFVDLSKRNKKGNDTTTKAKGKLAAKKSAVDHLKIDDIEIEAPTKAFLPLHGCTFSRIVIDEFTYVGSKQLPAILALQAPRRWILSGTPPHNTFLGVDSMAKLLGTTVGVSDDAELRYQMVKDSKTRDLSEGELFRSYATIHTPNWYAARYSRARAFIDLFVRKNTAFVRGIQKHDHYEKVVLAASERAAYVETFLLMVNQVTKISGSASCKKEAQNRADNSENSRTDRIAAHISASELPEDALITVCSSMPGFAITQQSSVTPCHDTVMEKQSLILRIMQDILSELRGAFWIISFYGDEIADIPDIYNYLRSVQENRFGDATLSKSLGFLFAYAQETKEWTVASLMEKKKPIGNVSSAKRKEYDMRTATEEPQNLPKPARIDDLKLRADRSTALTLVLDDVVGEWRFFAGAGRCLAGEEIKCSHCGKRSRDYGTMLFMGRCGHAGCHDCYHDKNRLGQSSGQCVDQQCGSKASASSLVAASDLTVALDSEWKQKHGSKMYAITELLLRIPKDEKVLIFAQFGRIMAALKKILGARGILFADTTEARSAAANVQRFRDNPCCKVCILQLDSANAAGWNLQHANHVLFVSSLVAKTAHEYKSSTTQALGRALRMGQRKDVHVYHFLAEKTIDVNILEERTGRVLVERHGECLLLKEREGREGDRPLAGVPFQGAVCAAGGGGCGGDEEEGGEDS